MSSLTIPGFEKCQDGFEIWNHVQAVDYFDLALSGRGEDDRGREY
jgi:hypothetical protein